MDKTNLGRIASYIKNVTDIAVTLPVDCEDKVEYLSWLQHQYPKKVFYIQSCMISWNIESLTSTWLTHTWKHRHATRNDLLIKIADLDSEIRPLRHLKEIFDEYNAAQFALEAAKRKMENYDCYG